MEFDERILRVARTAGTVRVASGPSRASRGSASTAPCGSRSASPAARSTARARARWRRAAGVVAGTYALNTALKLLVRRPRPAAARPAGVDRHAHAAQLPQRPRLDLVRRRAPLLAPGAARRARSTRSLRALAASAPVPGRPLPLRHPGAARCSGTAHQPRCAPMSTRIGIVGLPNAGKSSLFNALTTRGGGGRQLPVHDDRAQRRRRARRGPAPGRGRRHSSAPRRSSTTRSTSTTSPASSPAPTRARGSATASSPTSARPTRSCTSCAPTATRASSTPRATCTRCATSRRSRPSSRSPTSSRPSGAWSASPKTRAAAIASPSPKRPGCTRSSPRCRPGGPRAPCRCPRRLPAPRATSAR